jgi:thymidylate kinase
MAPVELHEAMTALSDPAMALRKNRVGLSQVQELCDALDEKGVDYCHWKSNNALDRSLRGENDLDLLVRRSDVPGFAEILYRLGFKQAYSPSDRRLPGVQSYYGYDHAADKFVHVHAHYQLVLGHDMTKNYRLPIERALLDTAVYEESIRRTSPELEFVVFVIRMVLKHSTWDAILGRQGTLSAPEQEELHYLRAGTEPTTTSQILRQHLPYIDDSLFADCLRSLQPGHQIWMRMKAGQQLRSKLRPYVRSSQVMEVYLRLIRRSLRAIRRRVFGQVPKRSLASGGAIVAVVGGDGAGKSTIVGELSTWLSSEFDVINVHMGKPAWSLTTVAVRAILKIGRLLGLYPYSRSPILHMTDLDSSVFPGYPWLLREVCTARDRYLTYTNVRRYANNGGIVISDRFPLTQIKLMDGHRSHLIFDLEHVNKLVEILVRADEKYYQQISPPELLIILRVDPEIAVQRKTDEDAASVRVRSTEMWELDWKKTQAHVVDAGQSPAEVLSEVKALIWSEL